MNLEFVRSERIWLREKAERNEKWLQDEIGNDPSILGLGDLVLRNRDQGPIAMAATMSIWNGWHGALRDIPGQRISVCDAVS